LQNVPCSWISPRVSARPPRGSSLGCGGRSQLVQPPLMVYDGWLCPCLNGRSGQSSAAGRRQNGQGSMRRGGFCEKATRWWSGGSIDSITHNKPPGPQRSRNPTITQEVRLTFIPSPRMGHVLPFKVLCYSAEYVLAPQVSAMVCRAQVTSTRTGVIPGNTARDGLGGSSAQEDPASRR